MGLDWPEAVALVVVLVGLVVVSVDESWYFLMSLGESFVCRLYAAVQCRPHAGSTWRRSSADC